MQGWEAGSILEHIKGEMGGIYDFHQAYYSNQSL
jgi:hypothetical protein